jgi:hypothetical protein
MLSGWVGTPVLGRRTGGGCGGGGRGKDIIERASRSRGWAVAVSGLCGLAAGVGGEMRI